MSYDDDEKGFIRELYADLNIYNEEWTYCGSSSANGEEKRVGKELLITNYDVVEETDMFS